MRRREDGAQAVEFALLAPVLLLLLFGIIAFGLLFAQALALGNSARQAARYGVVNNSSRTCADVVTEAQNSARPLVSLPAASVTVTRGSSPGSATGVCGTSTNKPCAGSQPTDNIYVTLTFDADLVVPMPGMDSTKRLTGLGVFRCEFS